ncbi:DEAD/DEAH box helicase [Anopheles sinensis]|uniref:DEAD/DEAH box helicase n=1 Tax=Anopheles sinensis TaxID=74873 RepID=A0A084VNQ1_ANOSI|nr:DEAD/DEAH box helicase [Anopheles sinensis]
MCLFFYVLFNSQQQKHHRMDVAAGNGRPGDGTRRPQPIPIRCSGGTPSFRHHLHPRTTRSTAAGNWVY